MAQCTLETLSSSGVVNQVKPGQDAATGDARRTTTAHSIAAIARLHPCSACTAHQDQDGQRLPEITDSQRQESRAAPENAPGSWGLGKKSHT